MVIGIVWNRESMEIDIDVKKHEINTSNIFVFAVKTKLFAPPSHYDMGSHPHREKLSY